jgi:ASCH domain
MTTEATESQQPSPPMGVSSSEGLGGAAQMLPCLSIRQPWAWLILHGGKDIENREWPTKRRGRVLVHAAKGMTQDEWGRAWEFAWGTGNSAKAFEAGVTIKTIERGGIVGSVEIVDCVEDSDSRWFVGRHGFVLRDPRPLPFVPWKGALGFFGVPRAALVAATPNVELSR